jgi:hypothetical protein
MKRGPPSELILVESRREGSVPSRGRGGRQIVAASPILVPTAGVEPASPACETGVLPVNYAGVLNFLFSSQLGHLGNFSPNFLDVADQRSSPGRTMTSPTT